MRPLGPGDPRLLEGRGPEALEVERTAAVLRRHGFVLLRGFARGVGDFEWITRRFAARFLVHGNVNRPFASDGGKTQGVDAGLHPLPLHSEMSYGPFYPDTLWFYCDTPPSEAGETTVCDGVELYEALAEESRAYFRENRLRYRHRYPPQAWQRGVGTRRRSLASAMLWIGSKLRRRRGRYRFRFDPEQHLCVDYVTSPLVPLMDGRLAFANSLEISTVPQVIALRGGAVSPERSDGFPAAVMADVARAADLAGVRVGWQAHDVLMIDNARSMHGRVALEPDGRKILVRMGSRKRAFRTAAN